MSVAAQTAAPVAVPEEQVVADPHVQATGRITTVERLGLGLDRERLAQLREEGVI